MNLQFLADGLIMGALIGLGRDRRHADLFDPALRQFRPWRVHRLGHLCRARSCRRRRLLLGGDCGTDRPASPSAGRWSSPGSSRRFSPVCSHSPSTACCFRKLRSRGNAIVMVMASFGASMALRSLLEFIFTSEPAYFTRDIQMALPLGLGIKLTPDQIFLLAMTAALVVGMDRFMARARSAGPCARFRKIRCLPASPASMSTASSARPG